MRAVLAIQITPLQLRTLHKDAHNAKNGAHIVGSIVIRSRSNHWTSPVYHFFAYSGPSSSTTTAGGGEWEVVSDLQCLNVSKEKREQMGKVFDFTSLTSLEKWLAKLWNGDGIDLRKRSQLDRFSRM